VEYVGLNSLFSSIIQVLSLSELGISSAIVFSLYEPIANDDKELICAYMGFLRKMYIIIGIIITAIGLLILPFLPNLIKGDIPKGINIYLLYLIYLLNTSIGYFAFAYKNAIINAYQRNDIVSNINTITQVFMYITQVLILVTTKNYYIYLLAMPLFMLCNNIITAITANKMFPEYRCKGELSKYEVKNVKHQVMGLMVHRLCQISRNSFDSIFISAYLGLQMVAIYSNYYYVMNALIGIFAVISNALVAGVGNSIATESESKNYNDFKKINFIYMTFAGWCTIFMLCLYQTFMDIWVGKELMFNFKIVVLLCIYFYALKMGDVRGMYSDAAGLWWKNRYRAIVEAVLNILLNAVLVNYFGIYGIIIATLISLLLINFIWGSQIIFKYYFKSFKPTEFFLLHFNYSVVSTIIAIVTYIVCLQNHSVGLVKLITDGLICCFIPPIMYVVIYRKTKEYKVVKNWVKDLYFEKVKFKNK
jgi:O-antigen/teichoic acid export membrane protein